MVWQDNIPKHPFMEEPSGMKWLKVASRFTSLQPRSSWRDWECERRPPQGNNKHGRPSFLSMSFFFFLHRLCECLCYPKASAHSAVTAGQKTGRCSLGFSYRAGLGNFEINMTAAGFYSEVILRSSLKILSEEVIIEVISLVEDARLCAKHPTGSAFP